VHNRRTSALNILPWAETPHILTRTVKALKSIPPAPAPSALRFREAKNALGETFGTKKAKASIRAMERNRVDVSAMEGVMDFVMDGIDKGAIGLPTQGTFAKPSPTPLISDLDTRPSRKRQPNRQQIATGLYPHLMLPQRSLRMCILCMALFQK
jgi:hypothetical protein